MAKNNPWCTRTFLSFSLSLVANQWGLILCLTQVDGWGLTDGGGGFACFYQSSFTKNDNS